EAAHERGEGARHEERRAEDAEKEKLAHAEIAPHRRSEYADRVEERAPREDLGDAERRDEGCHLAALRHVAEEAAARLAQLRPVPARRRLEREREEDLRAVPVAVAPRDFHVHDERRAVERGLARAKLPRVH